MIINDQDPGRQLRSAIMRRSSQGFHTRHSSSTQVASAQDPRRTSRCSIADICCCVRALLFRARPDYGPGSKAVPKSDALGRRHALSRSPHPGNGSQQLHAWWIPAPTSSNKVLLVFHGHGYVIEQGFAGELRPLGEFIPLHSVGANLLCYPKRLRDNHRHSKFSTQLVK